MMGKVMIEMQIAFSEDIIRMGQNNFNITQHNYWGFYIYITKGALVVVKV